MPWCPKCKMEYKESVTICPDCGVELVKELVEDKILLPVADLEEEEAANRLVEFLASEQLDSTIEYSKDTNSFLVNVSQEQIERAKKCVHAFFQVEQETKVKSNSNEVLEALEAAKKEMENTSSSPYIKRAEKSKDLKSSAITFISFSIIGIIFVALNIAGVFSYLNNLLSYLVIGGMFLAFLWIGISSFRMSKKAAEEALEEEAVTKRLTDWLKENVTPELLDSFSDPSLSGEINFMRQMEGIKEQITQIFGEMDDSYLDLIVEEFYNETFETK